MSDPTSIQSVCKNCPTATSGLCKALIAASPSDTSTPPRKEGRLSANLYLQRRDERVADFKILKTGWAAMVQNIASGDRLIADFMVPGDVIGLGRWMKGSPFYSVQAISDVTFCSFAAQPVFDTTLVEPGLLRLLLERASDFTEQKQRRLFDIARRDAEARILSLLFGLYERFEARGLAQGGVMPFPLRQRHLADATGLTQVHVSRVMKTLRERKLLWIDKKGLHIPDLERVRTLLS